MRQNPGPMLGKRIRPRFIALSALSVLALWILAYWVYAWLNAVPKSFTDVFIEDLGDPWELPDEQYSKLQGNGELTISKLPGDSIRVTYLEILNACGNYRGSVAFEDSLLVLHVLNSSGGVCTSQTLYRISYSLPRSLYPGKRRLQQRWHAPYLTPWWLRPFKRWW